MPELPFKDFKRKPDYLGVFGVLDSDEGILLVANRRVIDGEVTTVWDLPGGGVEPGESLAEALRREMREETGLEVDVRDFLFVAEGERIRRGARTGVWRSFFFGIERTGGTLDLSGEPDIVDHRFVPRAELPALLNAPYHRGFCDWLASGGDLRYVFDRWRD
ncbi:MAG: NUDIX domain-containing protein [Planctomycetota bacterium]|jgi:ADP-ribose pyrophosphatase YjhB (NUDIX family)